MNTVQRFKKSNVFYILDITDHIIIHRPNDLPVSINFIKTISLFNYISRNLLHKYNDIPVSINVIKTILLMISLVDKYLV